MNEKWIQSRNGYGRYRNETEMWLAQHGGRTMFDLLTDEKGNYVVMVGYLGQEVKVYLPKI